MRWIPGDKPVVIKKHPNGLNDLSLDTFEVPECETLAEGIQFIGNEQDTLDYINRSLQKDARNMAYPILRAATKESTLDEVFENARQAIKKYRPQIRDSVTQKTKISGFDNAVAALQDLEDGATLSKEQLLQLLMASK